MSAHVILQTHYLLVQGLVYSFIISSLNYLFRCYHCCPSCHCQHQVQFSLSLCAFLDNQCLFSIKIWFSILDKDAPLPNDMLFSILFCFQKFYLLIFLEYLLPKNLKSLMHSWQ